MWTTHGLHLKCNLIYDGIQPQPLCYIADEMITIISDLLTSTGGPLIVIS